MINNYSFRYQSKGLDGIQILGLAYLHLGIFASFSIRMFIFYLQNNMLTCCKCIHASLNLIGRTVTG